MASPGGGEALDGANQASGDVRKSPLPAKAGWGLVEAQEMNSRAAIDDSENRWKNVGCTGTVKKWNGK